MTSPFQAAHQSLQDLGEQLKTIEAEVEQGRQRLLALERQAALNKTLTEAFQAFTQKPYLLRPLKGDRHELIIPKFVDFRAGWPVRSEGEYLVFEVSRFIDLLSPLPEWLRQELGYGVPDFRAHLDGDRLIVDEGDPAQVWDKLGGRKVFTTRIDNELRVRPKSRFDLVRDLVRQGILPYVPQPIPQEIVRQPAVNFSLRPEQARDFARFLSVGAVAVFATGGAGKTFFGMYAAAALTGPKLVLAPRRSILDQWRARMEVYSPTAFKETEFRTYQSVKAHGITGKYTLIIYDEVQHLPADMGVAAAQAETLARIGLSSTPWREDGQEDLIPALCGFPVGFDWPAGEPPETTVWVVDRAEDKLDLVRALVEKPAAGKTMIFVYRLNVGEAYAKALGVPFISGQTTHQLRAIEAADTFVISKVGDAGISVNAARVIEVDFLGGRAELGQRGLRLQHGEGRGDFHVILTRAELHTHSKRLTALYALGFEVRVARGPSDKPAPPPRRPAKAKPARPPSPALGPPAGERGANGAGGPEGQPTLPAPLAAKLAAARSAVARPAYVEKVFKACSQAALSPQEIAEALGSTSPTTLGRLRAAVKALLAQRLLVKDGADRYQVNAEEVRRLSALGELGRAMRS